MQSLYCTDGFDLAESKLLDKLQSSLEFAFISGLHKSFEKESVGYPDIDFGRQNIQKF